MVKLKEHTLKGSSKSYYGSRKMGYCQVCSAETLIADFKIMTDPKGILKNIKVCQECYNKANE